MTISQIEYFMSCVSLLSFKKAADVHYTSVSTISRQIASLEAELGVQLLVRDTHRVAVTEAGKLFFLRSQSILGEMSQYRSNLISIGQLPPDEKPELHIATYANDSMYRIMVDMLHGFPADWLSKPCRFVFPPEGRMMQAVLDGAAEIGVDSAEAVARYGDIFDSRLLCRSPFRLLVGRDHPLYGRSSVSVRELILRFPRYSDYLPAGCGELSVMSASIGYAEDLRRLGEYTITRIPQLIPILDHADKNSDEITNMMLLLPRELELMDFINFHSVRLTGEAVTTDYVLFWKRGNPDEDLYRFIDMTELVNR